MKRLFTPSISNCLNIVQMQLGQTFALTASIFFLFVSVTWVMIFSENNIAIGDSIPFSVSDNNGIPVTESLGGPVKLTPGEYKVIFDSSATNVLISEKKIRTASSSSGEFIQTTFGFLWSNRERSSHELQIKLASTGRVSLHAQTIESAERLISVPKTISTLFAGAMLMMAFFTLLVATLAETNIYPKYAVWMLATLAFGSITAGYDLIWIGRLASVELEQTAKKLICSIWAISTLHVYIAVLELRSASFKGVPFLRNFTKCWYFFGMISAFVPINLFMPAFWIGSSTTLLLLTAILGKTYDGLTSRASKAYLFAWLALLFSLGFELGTSLGLIERIATPVIVPSSLICCFFVGATISEFVDKERRQRNIALLLAEKTRNQLSTLFNSSPAGLVSYNQIGSVLAANPAALKLLGLSSKGSEREAQELNALFSNLQSTLKNRQHLLEVSTSEGSESRLLQIRIEQTNETIEAVITDNTSEANLKTFLENQLVVDPLTMLGNRRALLEKLSQIMTNLSPHASDCFGLIDLKSFADINTHFGQQAGDDALKQVSKMLQLYFNGTTLYRITADRFGILSLGGYQAMSMNLERFATALAGTTVESGRRQIKITCTTVAQNIRKFKKPEDVLAASSFLLLQTRLLGLSCKGFNTNDPLVEQWQEEQVYISLMRCDHWRTCISPHLQPLVSLKDNAAGANYEMLLRVKVDNQIQLPTAFLRAAESIGMMPEIDLHMLTQAIHWIESSCDTPDLVAVNLSGASLADTGFIQHLKSLLLTHRSAASHLCLEITESIAVKDLAGTAQFIDTVRGLGARVALDDFGQGYTNFSYLAHFPVDIIKIDGHLIQQLKGSQRHQAIVRCLTDLTHGLGLSCTAEWIEDEATAQMLARLGVDHAQGWYFGKAMPLDHWTSANFPVFQLQESSHLELVKPAPVVVFSEA